MMAARHRLFRSLFGTAGVLSAVVAPVMVGPMVVGPTSPRDTSSRDTSSWVAVVSSPTDDSVRLAETAETDRPATIVLRFDTNRLGQSWRGVGGSLTDASVALLADRPDAQHLLFDPDAAAGAHLNLLRVPMSATDFSTEWWTWDWDDQSKTASPHSSAIEAADLALAFTTFRPDLSVVATPWSAPASMKTTGRVDGGGLAAGSEDSYADLLVAQLDWLADRGLRVDAATIANEPGHESDYPSMTLTDEQLASVGERVAQHAASDVELWLVDHNWADHGRYERVAELAPDVWDGAAYHCYDGSPDDMKSLPVAPIVSECTGTGGAWDETFEWDARHLVVDAIEAGSTGLMMWNLALDPDRGPKRPGGCETCRGLLTIDPISGEMEPGPEFYTLAHLARAADPGAVSLAGDVDAELLAVAFLNPDGTIGVFGHNDSGTAQVVAVEIGGTEHRFEVDAGEMFTFRGPADGDG